jgi:hypothetical protein
LLKPGTCALHVSLVSYAMALLLRYSVASTACCKTLSHNLPQYWGHSARTRLPSRESNQRHYPSMRYFVFVCSLFKYFFRYRRIYSVKRQGDKWMMKYKGFGRKRSWPNYKVLSCHWLEGAEESHEKPQSGFPVSGSRFKPGTSMNTKHDVYHSITGFGVRGRTVGFSVGSIQDGFITHL